jgi:hypothetical protein
MEEVFDEIGQEAMGRTLEDGIVFEEETEAENEEPKKKRRLF